ncbi:winged helix-turn-helix transcriptional regulator [Mucilaginibacter sp. OK098]|jgi:DNA-binding HxlR family transcriptional regulator|uniref:winged helix-turn-helix transcriptional regulator n=1 Tax=Mucilaginibacter sp. OK098 TaxID=1855297 RepID=UPI0009129559|nr:helix-turn-helix domain-containing protein [Mucilaginibacter sp. OK098]SHM41109.1 transcriptional regulator, HxlR family [Mucilaginibacter sp. OK098]
MTKVKESSTIQENKQTAFKECPVTYVMEKIGGYWKPIILFHLLSGSKRYNELRRAIPTITEKVLTQQLKQLEADDLVIRNARPVIPPHVTYSLSASGLAMKPVLYAMAVWAIEEGNTNPAISYKSLNDFPGHNSPFIGTPVSTSLTHELL